MAQSWRKEVVMQERSSRREICAASAAGDRCSCYHFSITKIERKVRAAAQSHVMGSYRHRTKLRARCTVHKHNLRSFTTYLVYQCLRFSRRTKPYLTGTFSINRLKPQPRYKSPNSNPFLAMLGTAFLRVLADTLAVEFLDILLRPR
jgi:hypothetical protein